MGRGVLLRRLVYHYLSLTCVLFLSGKDDSWAIRSTKHVTEFRLRIKKEIFLAYTVQMRSFFYPFSLIIHVFTFLCGMAGQIALLRRCIARHRGLNV